MFDAFGEEASEALEDLKQILSEVLLSIVLRGVQKGNVRGAITQAKKEAKDPVNWLDVFDNAWILYKAPAKEEALQKEADDFDDDRQHWFDEADRIQTNAHKAPTYCKTAGWYKG